MRCGKTCSLRIDRRTGEMECIVHGTVVFHRQPHDMVEHEYGYNPYSESFLLRMRRYAQSEVQEMARMLNISESTFKKAVGRAVAKEKESPG